MTGPSLGGNVDKRVEESSNALPGSGAYAAPPNFELFKGHGAIAVAIEPEESRSLLLRGEITPKVQTTESSELVHIDRSVLIQVELVENLVRGQQSARNIF